MMVGRELGERFPLKDNEIAQTIFEVTKLARMGYFKNTNSDVKHGEILGVAGLMGAGRTEIMEAIFGCKKKDNGSVYLNGQELKINHPYDAIKAGIGFITADRKEQGLVIDASIPKNISLTNSHSISQQGVISVGKEKQLVKELIKRLQVRTTGPEQEVKSLSGGNQQKVVIAKWLGIQPKVLILDEPTRGVDVGAKQEI